LRKTLERSDVANFTVEEKLQIIEAYMAAGGNAGGLQIELEDDDYDQELANLTDEQFTDEQKELLDQKFAEIYAKDQELRAMLPPDIDGLTYIQKYQIIEHYERSREPDDLGASNDNVDSSVIMHEGKWYQKVQIEGKDEEYLIDE
jgi:hypothetical protein